MRTELGHPNAILARVRLKSKSPNEKGEGAKLGEGDLNSNLG